MKTFVSFVILFLMTRALFASDPSAPQKTGAFEHIQVLGDRRQAHRMCRRYLRHGAVTSAQLTHDRPPSRMGERGKGPIQDRNAMFNHMVEHITDQQPLLRGRAHLHVWP